MTDLVAGLEGTIARAYTQLGVWWPNPWWPSGNSSFDDCAAFVSWVLWGLDGGAPRQTIVSGIVERSGLQMIAGNQGIRRGDLLGLRWSDDVNYDHIAIALAAPDGNGYVSTIEANGGGNDLVAVRSRNIGYVHNYARPAYPGFASEGSTPLLDNTTDLLLENTMSWRIIRKNKPAGTDIYTGVLISDYSIVLFDSETDLAGYNAAQRAHGRQGQPVAEYLITDDDLARERALMAGRITAARAAFSVSFDPATLKAALVAALPGALAGIDLGNAAAVAKAVDAIMKDDFAALAAKIPTKATLS